jgi:DNA-binding NtrC family response regulator
LIRIGLYSEDRALQPLLSSALGKEFQVLLKANEDEIHQVLDVGGFDVVILDLDSGHESLKERITGSQRIIVSQIPSVVMADDGLRTAAVELMRLGAYGCCRRPPCIRDLKTMLHRAYKNSTLKQEPLTVQKRREVVGSCDQMIGSSPRMNRVYDLVRRVASLSASVLVTGDSGTGKELIARAIHTLGIRAGHPFVPVCCGSIPDTLIEAELFGHEKGAFTGTVGAREGYLEQARDGTLFLDEIGELSLSTQVKLLRVLQQREFRRLGSNKLVSLQARLIFATNQDLADKVVRKEFRNDLYYRIGVLKINAPPLREHQEDISDIATYFLQHYSAMYHKSIKTIEPGAMVLLKAYSWPGNVRELENVVQRSIILSDGESIRTEDLPSNIQEDRVITIDSYRATGSFDRNLRDYKFKLATTAVRDNNGNKTLAARSLQISRAYLHRLIRLDEAGRLAEQSDRDLGIA